MGFQYRSDAEVFLKELKERFQKFNLKLHPEKTRLIEFGRYTAERRKRYTDKKPETFSFLGFTHICGRTREGKFMIKRQTIKKKMRAKVKEIKKELIKRMHAPISEVGQWLKSVLIGHYRYYGVSGNCPAMNSFRYKIYCRWKRVLSRRSQKGYMTWEKMNQYVKRWLPNPRIYHQHPLERSGVYLR